MPRREPRAMQILIAVPDGRVARRIATRLLAARLCACAQTLGPVSSRYRWGGRVESARERLLLVKTRTVLFAAVAREVRRLHPYAVPEIVGMPLGPVEASYLRWLVEATRPAPRRAARSRRTGGAPPRGR